MKIPNIVNKIRTSIHSAHQRGLEDVEALSNELDRQRTEDTENYAMNLIPLMNSELYVYCKGFMNIH
jgi:hypothetical protein